MYVVEHESGIKQMVADKYLWAYVKTHDKAGHRVKCIEQVSIDEEE
jgi:hypothetical protein